nr:helix-turn-helix transcriptional regulator [Leisingera sp. ANG-M1]
MLNEAVLHLGANSLTVGSCRLEKDKQDFLLSSFDPRDFWKHYFDEGWYQYDPSAQNALAGVPQTFWEMPEPERFRARGALEDFANAAAAGKVRTLLSFTSSSPDNQVVSVFTVSGEKAVADFSRTQIQSFGMLAKIFSAANFSLVEHEQTHDLLRLSGRELEVLKLLKQGRVLAQIAFDLGISYRMVTRHLTSAKSKLGMPTNESALALAMELGLV